MRTSLCLGKFQILRGCRRQDLSDESNERKQLQYGICAHKPSGFCNCVWKYPVAIFPLNLDRPISEKNLSSRCWMNLSLSLTTSEDTPLLSLSLSSNSIPNCPDQNSSLIGSAPCLLSECRASMDRYCTFDSRHNSRYQNVSFSPPVSHVINNLSYPTQLLPVQWLMIMHDVWSLSLPFTPHLSHQRYLYLGVGRYYPLYYLQQQQQSR